MQNVMSKTTTTAIDGLDDPEAGVTWRRLPRTFGIRRRLKLTIEEFAVRFQIPAETVRSWEEGRATPDAAAVAYLRVIVHDPERVCLLAAPNLQWSYLATAKVGSRKSLTQPTGLSIWLRSYLT
jgi:transcriptional regulator with XRE-family HTH domain